MLRGKCTTLHIFADKSFCLSAPFGRTRRASGQRAAATAEVGANDLTPAIAGCRSRESCLSKQTRCQTHLSLIYERVHGRETCQDQIRGSDPGSGNSSDPPKIFSSWISDCSEQLLASSGTLASPPPWSDNYLRQFDNTPLRESPRARGSRCVPTVRRCRRRPRDRSDARPWWDLASRRALVPSERGCSSEAVAAHAVIFSHSYTPRPLDISVS